MKGVNHRYLELSIKLPKKLSFFEVRIRTLLKQYISRGKVDVFILKHLRIILLFYQKAFFCILLKSLESVLQFAQHTLSFHPIGFGRFETDTKERKITVEMKGVNHRYLELSIKSFFK